MRFNPHPLSHSQVYVPNRRQGGKMPSPERFIFKLLSVCSALLLPGNRKPFPPTCFLTTPPMSPSYSSVKVPGHASRYCLSWVTLYKTEQRHNCLDSTLTSHTKEYWELEELIPLEPKTHTLPKDFKIAHVHCSLKQINRLNNLKKT